MLATSPSLSPMSLSSSPSLSANTAGSPLPIIPKRTSSSRPLSSGFISPPRATSSTVMITVQQATPPENRASSSGANSDSTSSSSPKRRSLVRVKASRNLQKSPADFPSSPTLELSSSSKSHKKALKAPIQSTIPVSLSLGSLPSRFSSEQSKTRSKAFVEFPSVGLTHKSAPIPPPLVIRKKSGQLLKSSLKSKSSFRGALDITPGGLSSKSEPATPTIAKAVKFDAHLEHVKLFLAEQRPLAVSRDGSPTDDTSGTESDFPTFIFGDRKSKALKMTVTNMPPSLNLNADVVLQEMKLALDGVSIVGRIRVRNLSFQKWLAVRFTFDSWQTTSEITAKYVESPNPDFDIFGFSIKLSDILARIEEKTLILALRYNTEGREIWDNNFGRNYVASFGREQIEQEPSKTNVTLERDISSGSDISDLHSRLEKVFRRRNDEDAGRFVLPPAITSPDPQSGSLASRYDFSTSFKSAARPSSVFSIRDHARTHSYPESSSSNSVPWPVPKRGHPFLIDKLGSSLGSLRDVDESESFRPTPSLSSEAEDGSEREPVERNHQRGYFDIGIGSTSNIRMTPPGTPRSRSYDETTPSSSPRFNSLPSIRPPGTFRPPGLGMPMSLKDDKADDISSGSTSNSTTPSGSPFVLSPTEHAGPTTNYNQFLDKFCFFTGSESSGNSSDESPSDNVSRSSSISSMEEFVTSSSPRLFDPAYRLFSSQPVTQTRDDISIRLSSGSYPPPTSREESLDLDC
ncbi:hypothetical protein D9757_012648 [Collybiopsis confluens]|uniref:CBM21 domain-containing protein n=1 Tax=Collybiopsis confluens TaxID=2823264 RepID=A0A8H5D3V9_9AGAR|nr:hypothetical protein D9757_012648 [Collybiopsis confluens]